MLWQHEMLSQNGPHPATSEQDTSHQKQLEKTAAGETGNDIMACCSGTTETFPREKPRQHLLA
jgi:hypothetical protein